MTQYVLFLLLGALLVKVVEIFFNRKKPPDITNQQGTLPLTQGTVIIDGKPTSVLILDTPTVAKTNVKQTVATFKPLPKRKFKLLE